MEKGDRKGKNAGWPIKILTAKEVSEYLKLSESTIYKLASKGKIPGFKIGDSWRFDMEEILKMIRGIQGGEINGGERTHGGV